MSGIHDRGLHRLAIVAAVLTYLLLTVGGVVTSRDAGMVFLDWPLSDGSLNPDGWLSNADKFSEHGHRLLGALVGLFTLALAWRLRRRESRRFVRVLGYVAVVGVCLQGLLGGLRVTEISTELALVHGCTGQAFFCLMVTLAYLTSRDAVTPAEAGGDTRGLSLCAAAVLFAVFMQVVLGAQQRHVGGPLESHLLGAALVAGSVLWLLPLTFLRHAGRTALARPVLLLVALLAVQITFGFLAAGVLHGARTGELTVGQVLVPTAHQSVGGLMLATSVYVCLRAVRRIQPVAVGGEVRA
jgi:cytochrome c oxidase assembly protein subunit 15